MQSLIQNDINKTNIPNYGGVVVVQNDDDDEEQQTATTTTNAGFSAGFVKFEESNDAVLICLFITILYMIGSVSFFSYDWNNDGQQWSYIDSIYFTVVTFTTCGYGDLYPINDTERLFTCLFILVGVAMLGGLVLGMLTERCADAYDAAVKKSVHSSDQRFIEQFKRNDLEITGSVRTTDDNENENSVESMHFCKAFMNATCPMIPSLVIMILGALLIGNLEGWTVITSMYYCIVTATSVGYGDIVPTTDTTKLMAILFIPLSVAVMADFFGRITTTIIEHKATIRESEFYNRKFTNVDFEAMDVNDDGQVSETEFFTFMLVSMGKVNHDDMVQLACIYKSLDKDGDGRLTMNDLKERVCGQ